MTALVCSGASWLTILGLLGFFALCAYVLWLGLRGPL